MRAAVEFLGLVAHVAQGAHLSLERSQRSSHNNYNARVVLVVCVCGGACAVKSLFEWRDKQKSGQVTLDMDSLLEITSDF